MFDKINYLQLVVTNVIDNNCDTANSEDVSNLKAQITSLQCGFPPEHVLQVLQGSVAMLTRWGGKSVYHFVANLFKKL